MYRPTTARQQEIFNFIVAFIESNRYPPTRRDISVNFGFKSTNAAESHLVALAKRKMIELVPGTVRGIRIKVAA